MIMRSKPKFSYCGLSIVLSNPSRFDKLRLLSANGGQMFDNFCLRPEINSLMCDVRLAEDNSPFLPDTKCILLLGQRAMEKYLPETFGSQLSNIRGGLYEYKGIPTICSFLPQDAADYKNYEASLNPLSSDYTPDSEISDGDEEDEGDVKAFGRTKRSNYAFWLRADVRKCKSMLSGRMESLQHIPNYKVYPSSEEAIDTLTNTKNEFLYFDIESDREEQNLQCFSFAFGDKELKLWSPIYAVPILDWNYKVAYLSFHLILRALSIAIRDNITVAHNGSNFDFFVLSHKYKIPIARTYDTMIAMHRCFPDIEKSLGHCVSYWTNEKFHKDEDLVAYRTHNQMMDRLKYNMKDVYTMYLVHQAITKYARTIPGLEDSIRDAMRCINPYLTSTLQGIKVDEKKEELMVNENDRLMFQYNRMIELLIGEEGMKNCRAEIKGKAKLIAGSNTQCCEYFHELMNYPVVARSSKTQKPSLGKKALYKLALKHENPVITLICAYRATQKETSRLRFIPWINTSNEDTNKIQFNGIRPNAECLITS